CDACQCVSGLLARAELGVARGRSRRVAIVTKDSVAPLYLGRFAAALEAAGVACTRIVVPDGEDHKDWPTLNAVFDALLEHRCDRPTAIVALGGGGVGRRRGVCAAARQRGGAVV